MSRPKTQTVSSRNAATNMRDVAMLAGVSVATVSNTLNNPEIVALVTRQRVQAAIKKLGWVRNESARQLRAGRSRFLGSVVIDASNPFFADVMSGAEAAAAKSGYAVLLANSAQEPEREGMHLDLFKEQRVGGILLAPILDLGDKVRDLRRFGIPVVLVDRPGDVRDLCAVSVDDVKGGHTAVEHLIEQGHRLIGFVGGPATLRQVRERQEGAARAVASHRLGIEALRLITTSHLNIDAGRQAANEVARFPKDRRPTALFAANDLLAIGLLQEFIAMGYRVPHDVAIIGYDDIEFAATSIVPLSSVRQPRFDLGRQAAELLLEEIDALDAGRAHRHQQIQFTPELVVRASSDMRRPNHAPDGRVTRRGPRTSHR